MILFNDGNWKVECKRAWVPAAIGACFPGAGRIITHWTWLFRYTRISVMMPNGQWRTYATIDRPMSIADAQRYWREARS